MLLPLAPGPSFQDGRSACIKMAKLGSMGLCIVKFVLLLYTYIAAPSQYSRTLYTCFCVTGLTHAELCGPCIVFKFANQEKKENLQSGHALCFTFGVPPAPTFCHAFSSEAPVLHHAEVPPTARTLSYVLAPSIATCPQAVASALGVCLRATATPSSCSLHPLYDRGNVLNHFLLRTVPAGVEVRSLLTIVAAGLTVFLYSL